MKTLNSLLQTGKISVFTLAGWLLSSSPLFAKGEPVEGGGSGQSSWVTSYGLVLLGIVLGMLVICRSSGRRDRIRPEAYVEGKINQGTEEKK